MSGKKRVRFRECDSSSDCPPGMECDTHKICVRYETKISNISLLAFLYNKMSPEYNLKRLKETVKAQLKFSSKSNIFIIHDGAHYSTLLPSKTTYSVPMQVIEKSEAPVPVAPIELSDGELDDNDFPSMYTEAGFNPNINWAIKETNVQFLRHAVKAFWYWTLLSLHTTPTLKNKGIIKTLQEANFMERGHTPI